MLLYRPNLHIGAKGQLRWSAYRILFLQRKTTQVQNSSIVLTPSHHMCPTKLRDTKYSCWLADQGWTTLPATSSHRRSRGYLLVHGADFPYQPIKHAKLMQTTELEPWWRRCWSLKSHKLLHCTFVCWLFSQWPRSRVHKVVETGDRLCPGSHLACC